MLGGLMRHLGSIALSLVLAPLIYVLAGLGMVKVDRALISQIGRSGSTDYASLAVGVLALLAAGLLYTLLVLPRLSPLGPVLAGLAFLVVQFWALFALANFVRTVPASVFGAGRAFE